MSKTLYINFRDNGFWAYDVVSSVFAKYLIDAAIKEAAGDFNHWLTEAIAHWRVNAVISDFGFHLEDGWSQSQIDTVIELCNKAASAIRDRSEIPATEVESWTIHDELSIDCRGHESIPSEPVARFGDAVIALLENRLPQPPDRHWWCFTLEENVNTIAMRSET